MSTGGFKQPDMSPCTSVWIDVRTCIRVYVLHLDIGTPIGQDVPQKHRRVSRRNEGNVEKGKETCHCLIITLCSVYRIESVTITLTRLFLRSLYSKHIKQFFKVLRILNLSNYRCHTNREALYQVLHAGCAGGGRGAAARRLPVAGHDGDGGVLLEAGSVVLENDGAHRCQWAR